MTLDSFWSLSMPAKAKLLLAFLAAAPHKVWSFADAADALHMPRIEVERAAHFLLGPDCPGGAALKGSPDRFELPAAHPVRGLFVQAEPPAPAPKAAPKAKGGV